MEGKGRGVTELFRQNGAPQSFGISLVLFTVLSVLCGSLSVFTLDSSLCFPQADMRLYEELSFLSALPGALAERLATKEEGSSPPLVIVYLSSLKVCGLAARVFVRFSLHCCRCCRMVAFVVGDTPRLRAWRLMFVPGIARRICTTVR